MLVHNLPHLFLGYQVGRFAIDGCVISGAVMTDLDILAAIAGCDFFIEPRVGRKTAARRVRDKCDPDLDRQNADRLGIMEELAAFRCQPIIDQHGVVRSLSPPPLGFVPRVWGSKIGSRPQERAFLRHGDKGCLLAQVTLRGCFRIDLSEWDNATEAVDGEAPTYSSIFEFARVGTGSTNPSVNDDLCASPLSRARCVDNVRCFGKAGHYLVLGTVLRSYTGTAKASFTFRNVPDPVITGGECVCVAGSSVYLCRHMLALAFRFVQRHIDGVGSTDHARGWGFLAGAPCNQGGVATELFTTTWKARPIDSAKRDYNRRHQLDELEPQRLDDHARERAEDLEQLMAEFRDIERATSAPPPPPPQQLWTQGGPPTPLDGTTYKTPHTLLATPHTAFHLLTCKHTIHHHACMPGFLCPCCVRTFAFTNNTCHVCLLTCALACSCWFICNTMKPIKPHTVSHTDHTHMRPHSRAHAVCLLS